MKPTFGPSVLSTFDQQPFSPGSFLARRSKMNRKERERERVVRVLNVQKGETDSHGPLTTTTRPLALHDNRRIVLTNAKIRSNEPVATCECIYPRIVRHRRAHEK